MWLFFMLLILFLTPHNVENKKKSRPLYFVSAKYDKNIKFLNNFEISIDNDNTSINILMDVRQDLDKLWSNTNIFIWLRAINDYKQIVTYDINLCQHLENLKTNKANIMRTWVLNFLKYGNLTKSCPIVKNLYYVANLKPDKESIPPFTPAGRCRLIANIYTTENVTKEVIGSVEFDMELK